MSGTRHRSVRPTTLLLLGLVGLLLPGAVHAQSTVDARVAEFTPSPDHAASSGGTPIVSSYQMQIFTAGTSQLVRSVDLGKPAPDLDGKIRVDFVSRLSSPLPGGVQYQARVAAVGPGGTGVSETSNTFTYSPTCSYTISPASRTSPAAGETTSVSVASASGCTWSASSNATWLTVGGGSSGTGNGSRSITIAPNSTTSSRTGTVTIAGQTFTVTQAAAACAFTVSPTTISAPATQATGTFSVSTSAGCTWNLAGVPPWITVASGTRTGSGTLSYSIAANSGQSSRSATLTVAGQLVAVDQAGAPPLASPTNLRIGRKQPSQP